MLEILVGLALKPTIVNTLPQGTATNSVGDTPRAGAHYGMSVAVSGDGTTLAIGADGLNSNQGGVYIYSLVSGAYVLKKLLTPTFTSNSYFGRSVALTYNGTTLAVGCIATSAGTGGGVYVYSWDGTNTTYIKELKATTNDSNVGTIGDKIAISGDGKTIAAGAPGMKSYFYGITSGRMFIFTLTAGTWSQFQMFSQAVGDQVAGDYFGNSVSLSYDGSTLAVGSYNKNAGIGAVYVYTLTGFYNLQQKLTGTDTVTIQAFGYSVALNHDGSHLVIGANTSNSFAGTTYLFKRVSGSWGQIQKLVPIAIPYKTGYGTIVCISGDGNMIMSTATGGGGAGYVFTKSGSTWSNTQTLVKVGGLASVYLGISGAMAKNGAPIVLGDYYQATSGLNQSGAASIFY